MLKRKVRKLIEEENPRQPLTDDQLAAEMAKPDKYLDTGPCFAPVILDDVREKLAEQAERSAPTE